MLLFCIILQAQLGTNFSILLQTTGWYHPGVEALDAWPLGGLGRVARPESSEGVQSNTSTPGVVRSDLLFEAGTAGITAKRLDTTAQGNHPGEPTACPRLVP